MKIFKKSLSFLFFAILLLNYSCSPGENEIEPLNEEEIQNSNTLGIDQEFDALVLANLNMDDLVTVELSPEEFEQALELTFGSSTNGIQDFFEDAENRKIFRQKLHKTLMDNQAGARGICDHTYYAEAYSGQQGYTSSSSNSFVYARRDGTTQLWAAAFSCVTFDEVYTGYYSTCPWTGPNCDGCRVRALYYSGGGNANIFGIGQCTM